jgi:hypothetical protein
MCLSISLSVAAADHMVNGTCISRREKQMMICGFQIEESELLTATFFAGSTGKSEKQGIRCSSQPSAHACGESRTLNGAGGARLVI